VSAGGRTIGIGELARRTGLTQQAIRAWETRFGFPVPQRTAGDRRQYAEADVERLHRVIALKDSGVRLASAVARVRSEDAEGGALSVYAELLRVHPHLERRVLRRPVLVAISHAIEDEAMTRAVRPYVFGAFQREEFFRAASRRWQEVARTAGACLVYADFPSGRAEQGAPVEVPLDRDSPLLREWAVVVVAPSFSVALTAWEVPQPDEVRDDVRLFETVFTFDPAAVRTAADVCLAAARASGDVDPALLQQVADGMVIDPSPGAAVDSLVIRAFDYLQRAAV
jgi:DNA-binding transcriptional MerR regulator